MKVTQIYFSPSGSTKKISNYLAAGFSSKIATVDLLQAPLDREQALNPDELLLVCMPVFAGRIPGICAESLAKLKSTGTPAV